MSHPMDPFEQTRAATGVSLADFGNEVMPMLLRYRDVRKAANDWARFSNNAPARLPLPDETDVRTLRQLPIETDPPDHTDYRDLVKPWFRRPTEAAYVARITALTDALLTTAVAAGQVNVETDLALPLQSRALTVLLNMPETEAETWIAWGTHAFRVEGRNVPQKAQVLLDYITTHVAAAMHDPGDDLFGHLARARFRGRPLTADEIAGVLHVTFAGGRDTVILTVAGALAHLSETPADLRRLWSEPGLALTATEEFVRYFSPLSHFGRVCPTGAEVGGHTVPPNGRVALCWASANFDPTVFADPTELRLDRAPNPHVGFGSGPHNCLGSLHARLVIRTVLERIAQRQIGLTAVRGLRVVTDVGGFARPHGFSDLVIAFKEGNGLGMV
jgi:cytochrome P450